MPDSGAPTCDASGGSVHFGKALAGLLVAGVIAGCSSGSKQPSPYCQHLAEVSSRLAGAEQDLFRNGPGGQAALSRIVDELRGLQTDAPAEIRRAIDNLVTAFRGAERALREPSARASHQLADAAQFLSTDGRKVTNYVASACK